jgi:NADH-quinone oxidoreductase subunit L
VVALFAAITRRLQTGFLYHYALAMILGLFALLTWFTSPLSAWLGK